MRASSPKKRLLYQAVEDVLADLQIGIPKAARLRKRQPQPGHLEIFRINPPPEFMLHYNIINYDGHLHAFPFVVAL